MQLSVSKNSNPNYLAKVVKLSNLRKHPKADRLQIETVDGNNVITGMNAEVGMLYVYFPLESQINKNYLSFSNSFSDPELNSDKSVKGYFGKAARVRATRLRSVPSEGYIVPAYDISKWLKSVYGFDFQFTVDMVDSYFDEINSIMICQKYVDQEALRKLKREQKQGKKDKVAKFNRLMEAQFHFHIDTLQLKTFVSNINPTDTIEITKKLHGTSVVLSNVLCNKKLNWKEKVAKFFGINVVESYYDVVYSSRKVVKNGFLDPSDNNPNHFYGTDIWGDCARKYGEFLKPGISLYGEIVGYTKDGGWVQKNYDYGCVPGDFELYVYRGTFTNIKGDVFEMSPTQLREYCSKYGIKCVPVLYYGPAGAMYQLDYNEHWHEEFLQKLMEEYLEKDCDMCSNTVPDEGICLRVDKPFEIEVYKLKSFRFFEHETAMADQGEVDLETIESSEPDPEVAQAA